jgi:hypothetical protein
MHGKTNLFIANPKGYISRVILIGRDNISTMVGLWVVIMEALIKWSMN